jgi:hypothetical protein
MLHPVCTHIAALDVEIYKAWIVLDKRSEIMQWTPKLRTTEKHVFN